jgi:uncharacterized oxidoreductase
MRAITGYVTASSPAKADEPVLVPGDPERLSRAKRMKEGVPVDPETWREILAAAESLGVALESPRVPA